MVAPHHRSIPFQGGLGNLWLDCIMMSQRSGPGEWTICGLHRSVRNFTSKVCAVYTAPDQGGQCIDPRLDRNQLFPPYLPQHKPLYPFSAHLLVLRPDVMPTWTCHRHVEASSIALARNVFLISSLYTSLTYAGLWRFTWSPVQQPYDQSRWSLDTSRSCSRLQICNPCLSLRHAM